MWGLCILGFAGYEVWDVGLGDMEFRLLGRSEVL